MALRLLRVGKHENWGTYNTLAYLGLGLGYIEWLGIQEQSVSIQVDDNPLIQQLVAELPLGDHLRGTKVPCHTEDISLC
jgi:hypothetical protein